MSRHWITSSYSLLDLIKTLREQRKILFNDFIIDFEMYDQRIWIMPWTDKSKFENEMFNSWLISGPKIDAC